MAANLTLSLSNRGRKGQIKKLPPSVSVPSSATVEEVKIAVARGAGVGDFNRVGLFDPQTKKILKDRKAVIGEQGTVVSSRELLGKDLGEHMAARLA